MIVVSINLVDGRIKRMQLSGHAGYAKRGFDLVCAGASAIAYGLCNSLDQLGSDCNIQISEANVIIEVNEVQDEMTQTIMQVGKYSLMTLQDEYPKFIKVDIQEV